MKVGLNGASEVVLINDDYIKEYNKNNRANLQSGEITVRQNACTFHD